MTGISDTRRGVCEMPCGESGAALRFLLPIAGALGAAAVFRREGRLPARPIEHLAALLREHGMSISEHGNDIYCEGKLLAGGYTLDAGISSQFATGLLLALPLLEGRSTLTLKGRIVSAPYISMTEQAMQLAQIPPERNGCTYSFAGRLRYALPGRVCAEGDWSGAAPFLCMGALSETGVTVRGLSQDSAQGDRRVLDLLSQAGAKASASSGEVTVKRGELHGFTFDAGDTPDLVPVLAALAACAEGESRIYNASRLRDKESDRLSSAAAMLGALGADVSEEPDALKIRGRAGLRGGCADAYGDHRIAEAAAVAACRCSEEVILNGAECVEKSYPAFWEDLECLSMR